MASAVDDDTKRAVASGRDTAFAMLGTAKSHARKAFLVFVLGLFLTVYSLRKFIWDTLKADLNANPNINVIAVTPFDVILLQVKIGLVVGVLLAIPVVIYYSRDALRERGWWPQGRVSRWQLAVLGVFIAGLFVLGVSYAYFVFFPIMLGFLASNAAAAGFSPTWSIVKWTQFIFLMSMSFGLAAQLPLAMSVFSYTEIVSYETFREKWRYAVVGIFVFGAVFSPPDPFTQVMWAVPLMFLYGFSLALAKLVVLTKRSSESVSFRAVARRKWNVLAGTGVLSGALVYAFFTRGGLAAFNGLLGHLPAEYDPGTVPQPGALLGISTQAGAAIPAVAVALAATGAVLFYYAVQRLEADLTAAGGSIGDPTAIDLSNLDADGVRAAPPEAFEELSEADALERADAALSAGDEEKAQVILDRFDEGADAAGEGDAAGAGDGDDGEEYGMVTQRTAGVVDAFSAEETDEDDIGGYYTDIAFVLDSLTSKSFRIAGVFMVVMGATFFFLYKGGIRVIKETFLSRMPPQMVGDVDLVTLHPVEALIFEIKFATLVAAVSTLPIILYYAWPALKERGVAGGDRRILLVWGGTLVVGMAGGSLLGFFYVAPTVLSWLATDALQSHMVISYRINNFGWLVIALTVGIGLLAEIPVTVFLFHRGGLVPFSVMFGRWRVVVVGIFVVAAVATPGDLFTMLLFAVPISLSFGTGLAILWVYTLGGRRTNDRQGEPAD